MQAHLTHGSLANAAFVKRPFIDFKKFLCMRRVKTWLCSPVTSDRLFDLCVLHCNHERVGKEKTNRILATMAGEKRRRIDF